MNYDVLFGLNPTQILLGFVRASGMVVTAPFIQARAIPHQVKILFAGTLAVTVAPYIQSSLDLQTVSFWMAVVILIQEVLIGLIIGMMINLTIYGLQLAGYFFDIPMGFGMVNLLDPQSSEATPLLAQFNYVMAGLIFMAVNGHHTLILSFIKSYQVIQPGMLFVKTEAVGVFLKAFSMMFFLGFKIGIPVMGTIFLADMAMGMIAKLIPQINVFVAGFSVKIFIGIFILAVFIPTYIFIIEQAFSSSGWACRMLRIMLQHLTG